MSTDITRELGGNFSSWQKKKKKKLECQCPKQASLFSSQLFPFPSIALTVLENDPVPAKVKTWETTEYKLSKAVIQKRFYGAYAIPPGCWGGGGGGLYLKYIHCTIHCGGVNSG